MRCVQAMAHCFVVRWGEDLAEGRSVGTEMCEKDAMNPTRDEEPTRARDWARRIVEDCSVILNWSDWCWSIRISGPYGGKRGN